MRRGEVALGARGPWDGLTCRAEAHGRDSGTHLAPARGLRQRGGARRRHAQRSRSRRSGAAGSSAPRTSSGQSISLPGTGFCEVARVESEHEELCGVATWVRSVGGPRRRSRPSGVDAARGRAISPSSPGCGLARPRRRGRGNALGFRRKLQISYVPPTVRNWRGR